MVLADFLGNVPIIQLLMAFYSLHWTVSQAEVIVIMESITTYQRRIGIIMAGQYLCVQIVFHITHHTYTTGLLVVVMMQFVLTCTKEVSVAGQYLSVFITNTFIPHLRP